MSIGKILWVDLTIPDAERVRDFYRAVAGWEPQPVNMGDYDDYNMLPPGAPQPAAGVCHARGDNAGQPPQWMIYVGVANLAAALDACVRLGGKRLTEPRGAPGQQFCVIQDPAGAVMTLMEVGAGSHASE